MSKKSGKTEPKGKGSTDRNAARPAKPRRVKLGKYRSFRLQKRIRHPVRLPNVWRITRKAALTLWEHKWLFAGITLVYGFLNLALAQGVAGGTDVSSLKESLRQVFTGHFGFVPTSLSIFAVMVSSAGNTSDQTAGAYQSMLAIIASLAIIWALRQVLSGPKGSKSAKSAPRVRDAYYRGMYPLIPFILVILVMGLQLIPLIIGSTLYSTVVNNGIAVYAAEKVVWALLFAMLGLLSLYMLTSSVFALYIVTLPDMTPTKALRSARELVRYRRWTVLRKLLGMPVMLLLAALIVMLPIITLAAPAARWVFFILTMCGLAAVHAYVYTLYRELLND